MGKNPTPVNSRWLTSLTANCARSVSRVGWLPERSISTTLRSKSVIPMVLFIQSILRHATRSERSSNSNYSRRVNPAPYKNSLTAQHNLKVLEHA